MATKDDMYLCWPQRKWEKTGRINENGRPLYASRPLTAEDKAKRMEVDEELIQVHFSNLRERQNEV